MTCGNAFHSSLNRMNISWFSNAGEVTLLHASMVLLSGVSDDARESLLIAKCTASLSSVSIALFLMLALSPEMATVRGSFWARDFCENSVMGFQSDTALLLAPPMVLDPPAATPFCGPFAPEPAAATTSPEPLLSLAAAPAEPPIRPFRLSTTCCRDASSLPTSALSTGMNPARSTLLFHTPPVPRKSCGLTNTILSNPAML